MSSNITLLWNLPGWPWTGILLVIIVSGIILYIEFVPYIKNRPHIVRIKKKLEEI
jgi:hypothetical protein